MYASGLARWSRGTVWVVHVLLPRHSPMLRALLCALYTLSLSRSLLPLSPPSPFPFSPSIRHSASSSQFLQISSPSSSRLSLSLSLFDRIIFELVYVLNESPPPSPSFYIISVQSAWEEEREVEGRRGTTYFQFD